MTLTPLTRRAVLLGSGASAASISFAGPGRAGPAAPLVKRRVLALFDGSIETRLKETNVHGLAAMPLEWLGLTIDYVDVREPLPPIWNDPTCRGVLTWFPEPNLADYAAYVTWIERAAAAGLKLVQIGDAAPRPGSLTSATEAPLRRRLFAALGIQALGEWSAVTLGDQVTFRDPDHTEFEFRFDAGLPAYERYLPATADARSWLVVTRADQARSPSHLVVVSTAGGFIAPGYAAGADPATGVKQWFVDPFAFFAAAFATQDLPAADTTTLCGRRIYYSHIDGDGWRSVSQIHGIGRASATNAEVVLQAVVAPNPDLPVTVAPIAAEMDPGYAGDLRAIGAARALFRLDHVEAATHTYTHPFRWSFFEHYTTEAEQPFAAAFRGAAGGQVQVSELSSAPPGSANCCSRAARDGQSPPRAFGGRPFDLNQEVSGSVALIESVAAASGKRVRLLQWPGDCSPFPAALRCVADAGLLNINGGDTRCDQEFPSITAIAPLGFQRHGLTQIYASMSSEELYTDLWTDRFFGFRDLPETWDRTGSPRRLKPFNLYYHMYSGERRASLDALLSNIAALRARGDYIGIFASHFASIAQGFFTMSLTREGLSAWRVRNRGDLQTIRFAADRMIDLAASIGVLGERVVAGQLYVALDPAVAAPLIATVARTTAAPPRPALVHSAWTVSELSADAGRATFVAEGLAAGSMTWRVPAPGRWLARAGDERRDVAVGPDLQLALEWPAIAARPLRVSIERAAS